MQISQVDVARSCPESEIFGTLLDFDESVVLDIGCGKADHTRRIAMAHPTATIVASEVDCIQHAANLRAEAPPNIRFANFGAECMPLESGSIDIAMMFKSLHHVPTNRLDDAMDEIIRVLRPGGLAYLSEPVFDGPLNEMVRIFNDEAVVRKAAFDAVCRAVKGGLAELVQEVFFLQPVRYRDFAEFAQRHFEVTHSERRVSAPQRAEVERLFKTHLGPTGAEFGQPMRVDLLRKPLAVSVNSTETQAA